MDSINSTTTLGIRKYNYHWLRVGLLILVGLIAPFSLFYFSYYDSRIAQQEVRFFRSLNELENAISQTIGNLPFIHEKGFGELVTIKSLDSQKDVLLKRIKKLEDGIATEKTKRRKFIKDRQPLETNQKKLESLNIQNSEVKRDYLEYQKLFENIQTALEVQFSQNKEVFAANERHINDIEGHINDILNKINACNAPLINKKGFTVNIKSPSKGTATNKKYIESYLTDLTTINNFSETVIDRLNNQECHLLLVDYKTSLIDNANNIKDQFDIVNPELELQLKTISNSQDDIISQDYSRINSPLQNLNPKIITASEIINKGYAEIKAQIESCNNEFTVNSLSGVLESFLQKLKNKKLSTEFDPDSFNEEVNLYIKTLGQSRKKVLLIKKQCSLINDNLDKHIDELPNYYTTYISFLSELINTSENISYLIKIENDFKTELGDIDSKIKKLQNSGGTDIPNPLSDIIERIDGLEESKIETKNKLLSIEKKKQEVQKHSDLFKVTIKSVKQTLGFEHIDVVRSDNFEKPCNQVIADSIINVIVPKPDGRHMILRTLDGREGQQHFHIKVPLDDIINAQVSTLSTRFDQVLIADATGKIYYLSSRQHFGEKKQLGRFQYNPFTYDFVGYQNVKDILEIADNQKILPKESKPVNVGQQKQHFSGLSRINSISVGDKDFRTFIQPIKLPAKFCEPSNRKIAGKSIEKNIKKESEKGFENGTKQSLEHDVKIEAEQQWYLIGVINEDRFQKIALAAPPVVVGFAILLTIIALALLPFLKIVLADRHTLLTRRLRSLVVWSLGIVCSFAVLLLCLFISYYMISDENQRAVKQLNNDLIQQFNTELFNKLAAFELQFEIADHAVTTRSSPKYLTDLNSKVGITDGQLPFYTFMILNEEGKHAGLINSVKKSPIDKEASLKNRVYFNNALNGNTWKLNPVKNKPTDSTVLPDAAHQCTQTTPDFKEVYIQRIISYLDGQRETIFSGAVKGQQVAIMNARLDSFFRRVLPLHNSFAVIENNTGKVLFHSTPERDLVENFIDETDGDPGLIAKLYHQQEGPIKLIYQGQSIQAYVAPLLLEQDNGHVLWHLVTYKALDLDEELLLVTTLTVAALLLVLSALVFIVIELLTFCVSRKRIAQFVTSIRLVIKKKSCAKGLLLALFFLIMIVSAACYWVVLDSFGEATKNYASDYQHKASAFRAAGFQNIYKRLDWTKQLAVEDDEKISIDDYVTGMVKRYQLKPENSAMTERLQTGDFQLLQDMLPYLESILPVISYSTGVIAEHLKIDSKQKVMPYYTGVLPSDSDAKEAFFQTGSVILHVISLLLVLVLVFAIIKSIILAVDLVVLNLFSEVKRNSNVSAKTVPEITKSSTVDKNEILLLVTPEKLRERIKVKTQELDGKRGQVVTINSIDSLLQCPNVHPEGSVIFITDFASIVLQDESNKTLLTLLESFVAQKLQIIMASNIVPSYWLKVQEQHLGQQIVDDTGIAVDLYRWSQLLSDFDIIDIEDHYRCASNASRYSQFLKQWALCSFEEQSVLTSLASNNLVNRHNIEAIESLLHKGLIIPDPELIFQKNLRIKDQVFTDFIHDHFHKLNTEAWRNQGHGQLWSAILPVFLVVIMLVLVFLVMTGSDALQYSLSIIAALAASIPTLSVILSFFNNSK